MVKINTDKVVEALAPYGPIPVVITVVGISALGALSLDANPWAVCGIFFGVLGTIIWWQVSNVELRKRELEVEFDHVLRMNGKEILDKLERLQRKISRPDDLTLFGEDPDE
jgi:hypothetical protein